MTYPMPLVEFRAVIDGAITRGQPSAPVADALRALGRGTYAFGVSAKPEAVCPVLAIQALGEIGGFIRHYDDAMRDHWQAAAGIVVVAESC